MCRISVNVFAVIKTTHYFVAVFGLSLNMSKYSHKKQNQHLLQLFFSLVGYQAHKASYKHHPRSYMLIFSSSPC